MLIHVRLIHRSNRLLLLKWINNHDSIQNRIECLSNHCGDVDSQIRSYCRKEIQDIGLALLKDTVGIEGIYTLFSKMTVVNLKEINPSFQSIFIQFYKMEIKRLAKENKDNPNQLSQAKCIHYISQSIFSMIHLMNIVTYSLSKKGNWTFLQSFIKANANHLLILDSLVFKQTNIIIHYSVYQSDNTKLSVNCNYFNDHQKKDNHRKSSKYHKSTIEDQ